MKVNASVVDFCQFLNSFTKIVIIDTNDNNEVAYMGDRGEMEDGYYNDETIKEIRFGDDYYEDGSIIIYIWGEISPLLLLSQCKRLQMLREC